MVGANIGPPRRHFESDWEVIRRSSLSRRDKLIQFTTMMNTKLMLLNDYLFKVDCASMKESLEIRVPLLNEALFEFGVHLAANIKFKRNETKIVLRKLARQLLPREIANKPKWGFGIPIDTWLNTEAKREIEHILLADGDKNPLAEYYNYDIYSTWVRAFCRGLEMDGFSRQGLLQRVVMLLAVHYFLNEL